MFKNILSRVPFILCLAPNDGGGSAGGEAPPLTEPPPPPSKPPEPEGVTIEARLMSAQSIIADFFRRIGELTSQLATAGTQHTKLSDQFNAVSSDLTKEKEAHVLTTGELKKANTTIAGLTKERDDANGNVERLEKLCNLRGIDPNAAVPVPSSDRPDHEGKRAELVSKLDTESDPLKRGLIANELRDLDAKRREKK